MLHHYARLLRLACGKPSIMAASSGSSSADLTESTQTPTETAVRNALSQLRSPQASDLARSRVFATNKTRRGPGKSGKKSTVLKTCHVDTRIEEFKDEPFRKSNNKLFCEVCREEVSEKSSIIKRHIESAKHKSGKGSLSQKKERDITIIDAMKKYDQEVNPKGEMLIDNQRVFRVRVLKTFLKAKFRLTRWTIFGNY